MTLIIIYEDIEHLMRCNMYGHANSFSFYMLSRNPGNHK